MRPTAHAVRTAAHRRPSCCWLGGLFVRDGGALRMKTRSQISRVVVRCVVVRLASPVCRSSSNAGCIPLSVCERRSLLPPSPQRLQRNWVLYLEFFTPQKRCVVSSRRRCKCRREKDVSTAEHRPSIVALLWQPRWKIVDTRRRII